jgi:hypothetical protein
LYSCRICAAGGWPGLTGRGASAAARRRAVARAAWGFTGASSSTAQRGKRTTEGAPIGLGKKGAVEACLKKREGAALGEAGRGGAHLVMADGARVGEVHDAGQLATRLGAGVKRGRVGWGGGRWLQTPSTRPALLAVCCVAGLPSEVTADAGRIWHGRARQKGTSGCRVRGTQGVDHPVVMCPAPTISIDIGSSSGSTVMELGMSTTLSYLMI